MPMAPIASLMGTHSIVASGLHSAKLRLSAAAHNVVNLGSEPCHLVRVVQQEASSGWSTARTELVAGRLQRWLFNGLHSLDFSFWYSRRPLWDIGMIGLSLGGLASSGIGLWFGLGRVRRALGRMALRRSPRRG